MPLNAKAYKFKIKLIVDEYDSQIPCGETTLGKIISRQFVPSI